MGFGICPGAHAGERLSPIIDSVEREFCDFLSKAYRSTTDAYLARNTRYWKYAAHPEGKSKTG